MNACRFCNSTRVTFENGLGQCSNCYRSWLYKKNLDPFDLEMDDIFGDLDDLMPKKSKKRKNKVIKKPRLDIGASIKTKSTEYFSDMEDSEEERPLSRKRLEPLKQKAVINSESTTGSVTEPESVIESVMEPIQLGESMGDTQFEKGSTSDLDGEYQVMDNMNEQIFSEDDYEDEDENEEEEDENENTKVNEPMVLQSNIKTKEKKKQQRQMKPRPFNRFNPFILFNKEMRAKIKEENPEVDNYELSKIIGQMWKTLSPVKKEAYGKLSERKKEDYKNKPIHFSKRPKPPPNVWIVYSKEEVPKVREEFPNLNINEASKIAGQRWKAMSAEEQDVYRDRAKKAIDEFKLKYPEEAKHFYEQSAKKAQKTRNKNKNKK